MIYAILAYHVEAEVMSWTPEEDAAVMTDLHRVHSLNPCSRRWSVYDAGSGKSITARFRLPRRASHKAIIEYVVSQ